MFCRGGRGGGGGEREREISIVLNPHRNLVWQVIEATVEQTLCRERAAQKAEAKRKRTGQFRTDLDNASTTSEVKDDTYASLGAPVPAAKAAAEAKAVEDAAAAAELEARRLAEAHAELDASSDEEDLYAAPADTPTPLAGDKAETKRKRTIQFITDLDTASTTSEVKDDTYASLGAAVPAVKAAAKANAHQQIRFASSADEDLYKVPADTNSVEFGSSYAMPGVLKPARSSPAMPVREGGGKRDTPNWENMAPVLGYYDASRRGPGVKNPVVNQQTQRRPSTPANVPVANQQRVAQTQRRPAAPANVPVANQQHAWAQPKGTQRSPSPAPANVPVANQQRAWAQPKGTQRRPSPAYVQPPQSEL